MLYVAFSAGGNTWECSCCGHFFTDNQDFCPNCEEPLLFQYDEDEDEDEED